MAEAESAPASGPPLAVDAARARAGPSCGPTRPAPILYVAQLTNSLSLVTAPTRVSHTVSPRPPASLYSCALFASCFASRHSAGLSLRTLSPMRSMESRPSTALQGATPRRDVPQVKERPLSSHQCKPISQKPTQSLQASSNRPASRRCRRMSVIQQCRRA